MGVPKAFHKLGVCLVMVLLTGSLGLGSAG